MARRATGDINCLLGVDKPVGCTSHDVVYRVRRALGERRVGHAGTLDPLASGVMVVGVGQATRLLGLLTLDTKSYIAQIEFGCETNTDDAEGEPTRTAPCPPELSDPARASSAVSGLVGTVEQVPPAFSAISVNGVRAYKAARAGNAIDLPARTVTIMDAVLLGVDASESGDPVWTCAFTVSKGTYIRAIARDLGRSLGCAAHLSGLRRTSSGSITASSCVPVDGLSREAVLRSALDPVHALGLPAASIDEGALPDVLCGKRVPLGRTAPIDRYGRVPHDGGRVCLVCSGELRAIAEPRSGALVMKQVFPQGIGGLSR